MVGQCGKKVEDIEDNDEIQCALLLLSLMNLINGEMSVKAKGWIAAGFPGIK